MSSTDYSEFISQFGDTLVKPSDDHSTFTPSDALAGKEIVSVFIDDPKVIGFYLLDEISALILRAY